ncbi:FtsX-like permease family protein [Vaginisenegalia massiliensis]|uniref:FtsX-like permease family protein n=1 Tax=Vaginisenegalia massiliensis TaxID=2058294 RepID=UPI000F52A65D|nr:FtsX-like permease family protein [Vaginisenegalia massiliensis]
MKALWLDIFREIKVSAARFLSLFAIMCLGVAFFVGIKASAPSMLETARHYYSAYHLPDGKLMSTMGISQSDLTKLSELKGLDYYPQRSLDVVIQPGAESLKLYTRPKEAKYNFFKLVKGRYPEKVNEIALDANYLSHLNRRLNHPLKVGDRVQLQQLNLEKKENNQDSKAPHLQGRQFVITGFVQSPLYYERVNRGLKDDGKGSLSAFALVNEQAIQGDIYSEVYFWGRNTSRTEAYTEADDRRLDRLQDKIERQLNQQPLSRLNELKGQAQKRFDEAQMKIDDAYDKLDQAKNQLADQEQKLAQGRADYQAGQAKLAQGQEDYQSGYQKWTQGQAQFQLAVSQLLHQENQLEQQEQAYRDGLKQLDSAKSQVQQKFEQAEVLLTAKEKELNQANANLIQSKDQLQQGQAALDQAKLQLTGMYYSLIHELGSQGMKAGQSPQTYYQGLQDRQQNLEQEIQTLTSQQSQLEQQSLSLKQEQIQLQTQLTVLKANRQTAQNKLDEALVQVDSLKASVAEKEGHVQQAEAQLNQVNQQLIQLEQQLALDPTNANLLAQRTNLQQALSQAQEGVRGSQADLDASRQAYQIGQEQQEQAQSLVNQLQEQVSQQESKTSQVQANLTKIQQQISPQAQANRQRQIQTLNQSKQQIEALMRDVQPKIAIYNQISQTVAQQEMQLHLAQLQYQTGLEQWQSGLDQVKKGRQELAEQQSQAQKELKAKEADLISGRAKLNQGWQLLKEGQKQLSEQEGPLQAAKIKLDLALAQLNQGQAEAQTALTELEAGQEKLDQAKKNFADKDRQARKELDEKQEQLDREKAKVAELAQPTYYVHGRDYFVSYQSISDNAKKLATISNVFPTFFFAIAVFVTFSTIKRMADEQRNYMGTLKQMGYHNRQILTKFIVYAGLACSLGLIIGSWLGYQIFPKLVMNAYNTMYYFDQIVIDYEPLLIVGVTLIALSCALIPAVLTPLGLLTEEPAHLLRPQAPKAGKKILLERMNFIWSLFSFKQKMTIRNLIRYRGRSLMVILGVAGCTMLMVTGFGIGDSIRGMVDRQFDQIQPYDSLVYLQEDRHNQKEPAAFNQNAIRVKVPVMIKPFTVRQAGKTSQEVMLVVPLVDHASFRQVQKLHTRSMPQKDLDLDQFGPLVSEKLAQFIGQDQGGQVILESETKQTFKIPFKFATENYINHYVYLSAKDYRRIFHEPAQVNAYYLDYQKSAATKAIEAKLAQDKQITAILNIASLRQAASQPLKSLDMITLVLIISAAALAFVVLYNLTNINISERMRELSTIKVLGFYNREVSFYIFDELLILSVLGIALGLWFGRILNQYILTSMALDRMYFYPQISLLSYGLSAFLTLSFSVILMFVMHHKIKKINMVEALKAVE